MTEYAEKSIDEMASELIVNTCQLLPKSFSPVSVQMQNALLTATPYYSIICGSTAEFYIRPLNRCIGDIDLLDSRADELAFNDGFPSLPDDVSGLPDTIQCFKIESYQKYPGFVRLRFSEAMIYNWKCKRYTFCRHCLKSRPTYMIS